MNAKMLLVLAAVAASLAGCGGGGGGGSSGGTGLAAGGGIPDSALSSVPALVAYLQQLIAATSETGEPVDLGNARLPVDDNAEPLRL